MTRWLACAMCIACGTDATETTPAGSSGAAESTSAPPNTDTGSTTTSASSSESTAAEPSTDESSSSGTEESSSSSTGEEVVPQCDDVTSFAMSWSAWTGGEYESYGILWPSGFDVLIDDEGSVYAEFVLAAEGQVLRKLASDGSEAWTWPLGVAGLTIEAPVFQRSAMRWLPDGDAIVAGYVENDDGTTQDRFVARLDVDAQTIVWSDVLELPDGAGSEPTGVAIDTDGGIYVASMTETCCPVVRDTVLTKFDANGVVLWEHTIEDVMPQDVLVDDDGIVTVVRRDRMTFYRYTSDGRYLGPWSDELEGGAGLTRAAALDSQGRLVVSTMFPIDAVGNFIADVRRYDTELELEWRLEFEGVTYGSNVHALAIDPDDAILYAHHYDSPVTLYKIVDGEIVAEQAIEDATSLYGITMAADCGIVLGGRNTVGETTDLWLRRYDPA